MEEKSFNSLTTRSKLSERNNRRHAEDYKNDPNYECRVRTITREKIYSSGVKVTRVTTKINDKPQDKSRVYDYPQKMIGHSTVLGNTSYMDGISPRKHPRIVNNSPKFKMIHGKRIQVRAIAIRRLTKTAIETIKSGMAHTLKDSFGKVEKMFLKTVLKINQYNPTRGWTNPMEGRWLRHYNILSKRLDGESGITPISN